MAFHQSFDLPIWTAILLFGAITICILLIAFIFTIYQLNCKPAKSGGSPKSSPTSNNRPSPTPRSTTIPSHAQSMQHTHSHKSTKSKLSIHSNIKILSLCSLFFFILAQIANHLYIAYIKLPTGTINTFNENLWGCYNSFWAFAYGFTYLLFYERLRKTFKNSQHSLSKRTKFTFLLIVFCFIASQQMISITWLLFVLDILDWAKFNAIYQPALWIKFSIDWIFNIYIVYLFCSKIYKITIEKHRRDSMRNVMANNNRKNTDNSFRSAHSAKLFNVMIKYFLLTFLTVLSTQIFTASQIVLSISIGHAIDTGLFEFYYKAYMVHFVLGCIDSMVSTLYIMLTFPFAKEWYRKFCTCLHDECTQCWSKAAMLDQMETNHNHIISNIASDTTKSVPTLKVNGHDNQNSHNINTATNTPISIGKVDGLHIESKYPNTFDHGASSNSNNTSNSSPSSNDTATV